MAGRIEPHGLVAGELVRLTDTDREGTPDAPPDLLGTIKHVENDWITVICTPDDREIRLQVWLFVGYEFGTPDDSPSPAEEIVGGPDDGRRYRVTRIQASINHQPPRSTP